MAVPLRAALAAITLAFTTTPLLVQAEAPALLGGPSLTLDKIPASAFRSELERLTPAAQQQAMEKLRAVGFPAADVDHLRVDKDGGVLYACAFEQPPTSAEQFPEVAPGVEDASVPVSPFPNSLKFHSRPGATNVIYLDFDGETTGFNAWFSSTNYYALAFSIDTNYAQYSDAEQRSIKDVWKHVAEDYAPFNVDVTTERPATMHNNVAHTLITKSTDARGFVHPYSYAGGVAYVGVFGNSNYQSFYAPAWVFYENLSYTESYIAEAASHEVGHNLGLSHDGQTNGVGYYSGHGSGETSWSAIMGVGYYVNVSQWSRGEYHMANNTQDDLSIIATDLGYRPDDHSNTRTSGTPIQFTGVTNIVSTTPENDPANTNTANKGIINNTNDVDWFSLTASGAVHITVSTLNITSAWNNGGNLDVEAGLYNSSGTLILQSSPTNTVTATLSTNVPNGTYYLRVRGVGFGSPLATNPLGFTAYASGGQYFITGRKGGSGGGSFLSSYSNMTVAGTFQGWNQLANNMSLVANYTWQYDVNLVNAAAPAFKFVANNNWGINWGEQNQSDFDVPASGTAELGNFGNISINHTLNGSYRITFNEQTRAYSVTQMIVDTDGDGLPDSWEIQYFGNLSQGPNGDPDGDGKSNMTEYLAGWDPTVPNYLSNYSSMTVAGTFQGWNQNANNMSMTADYTWVSTQTLNNATGVRFKFVANANWGINWGESNQSDLDIPILGQTAESGNGDILANGTLNGTYVFTFNEQTRAYTVVRIGGGFISNYSSMTAAGTFNGWNQAANNMTLVGDYVWEGTLPVNATNPEFKFVANANWGNNWGESDQSDFTIPMMTGAEVGAGNIRILQAVNANIKFSFNEQTRTYIVTQP